jgi:hypothetical protein
MAPIDPRRSGVVLALTLAGSVLLAAATASGAAGRTPLAQRFIISETMIRGVEKPDTVAAVGPISGVGTIQHPAAAGQVNRLIFRFAKGSVVLLTRETSTTNHPDYRACSDLNGGRGTYTITGATGAFRGATGNGIYLRREKLMGARSPSGACLRNRASAVHGTIRLTGAVTLA